MYLAVGWESREQKSVTGEVGKHRAGKKISQPFPFPYRSRTVPTIFPVPTFTARSPEKSSPWLQGRKPGKTTYSPSRTKQKSKALHGRLKSQRDGTGGKLTVDPPFSFRRERGTSKIQGWKFLAGRDGIFLGKILGGTGRLFFFFEAGRGGCCFFPRRDGAVVFFSEAGRGGCIFRMLASPSASNISDSGATSDVPDGAGCCCSFCSSCCCCCCDGDGTSAAPACGGWPAPLFGCGFKYASITAKHRLRGGVLVSVWERLHQSKTEN